MQLTYFAANVYYVVFCIDNFYLLCIFELLFVELTFQSDSLKYDDSFMGCYPRLTPFQQLYATNPMFKP